MPDNWAPESGRECGTSHAGWHRVVVKLSGALFAGSESLGISPDVVAHLAEEIAEARAQDVQIAAVVGGGNMFRGAALAERGIDRARADYMGMLSTVINALALQDALEQGRVVIFGAGLGAPFFSTDTAAAQRALEIGAQALLKGTKVDGVYDADPRTNPGATRFPRLD